MMILGGSGSFRSDLKEVLLQAAIYAGVPAANTGFHLASQEIEKAGAR